jgi:predicted RNase H-like nuclease (RuvC/YqgF family)
VNSEEYMMNSWLTELQVAVDTLREDKKGLQARVTELEKEITMYKTMVERLQLAVSQGRDYYV